VLGGRPQASPLPLAAPESSPLPALARLDPHPTGYRARHQPRLRCTLLKPSPHGRTHHHAPPPPQIPPAPPPRRAPVLPAHPPAPPPRRAPARALPACPHGGLVRLRRQLPCPGAACCRGEFPVPLRCCSRATLMCCAAVSRLIVVVAVISCFLNLLGR